MTDTQDRADKGTFFRATEADFKEVAAPPEREPDYVSESGSSYWYTEAGVYRRSDHWGGVASCRWYLDGRHVAPWCGTEYKTWPRDVILPCCYNYRPCHGPLTGFASWAGFSLVPNRRGVRLRGPLGRAYEGVTRISFEDVRRGSIERDGRTYRLMWCGYDSVTGIGYEAVRVK